MKNKFLIEDMAKIHNMSTQTLRYYDKIGLFNPKIVDENNGYRYYTIEQFELYLKNLQRLFKDNDLIFTGEIGVIVPRDNLKRNRFDGYNAVYIVIKEKLEYKNIKKLPVGKYACIYHKGPYKTSFRSYEKLLNYIRDNDYEMVGDAIEVGLIHGSIIQNEEDYLTEIQIPIK